MGFKVLILHHQYTETDGSSIALRGYLKDNNDIAYYKVLSRKATFHDINIIEVNSWKDIRDELDKEDYDVIHNFRFIGYELFQWTIKSLKYLNKNIKIITTINQRPSYVGTLISPLEIRHSDYIVLIDSTAYNDPILKFIPNKRKQKIYYCTSENKNLFEELYLERKKRTDSDIVKFGRGSTINKCPLDMIDNFSKIDYDKKEFHIVGIPDRSWVKEQTIGKSNIFTYPLLPVKDWLNILKEIDIFLYQLPSNAYSSLDGTLGAAMLLGIPVVYYGPEAPKERFKNGINGYVAESTEQLIDYCTKLANDKELRHRIGEAGRQSTLKQFDWETTVKSYNELYGANKNYQKIRVPLSYKLLFFRNSFKKYFRWYLEGTIIEKIYRLIKYSDYL